MCKIEIWWFVEIYWLFSNYGYEKTFDVGNNQQSRQAIGLIDISLLEDEYSGNSHQSNDGNFIAIVIQTVVAPNFSLNWKKEDINVLFDSQHFLEDDSFYCSQFCS